MGSLCPVEYFLFDCSSQPKSTDFGWLTSSTSHRFCICRLSSFWKLNLLRSCFHWEDPSLESAENEGYSKKNQFLVDLLRSYFMRVATILYDPIQYCISSSKITYNSCSLRMDTRFIISLYLAFCTCKFETRPFCQPLSCVESWWHFHKCIEVWVELRYATLSNWGDVEF